jgi:hypothetical protein
VGGQPVTWPYCRLLPPNPLNQTHKEVVVEKCCACQVKGTRLYGQVPDFSFPEEDFEGVDVFDYF